MNILELFKGIKTLVFDMDGVLTDGSLLILPDGIMARRMNIKDGYALQLAVKKGYNIVIVSGGSSPDAKNRLQKLGIQEVYLEVADKLIFLESYLNTHQLSWNNMLYMGDDIPDLEVMKMVKLACCPEDAVSEIRTVSKYISPVKGGFGCVRDVIEKALKLNGHWD